MATTQADRWLNRELSWIAFNGRVLQQADDPDIPLGERLAFLAIFSSNLDEFFRVRVASLRTLLRLESPPPGAAALLRDILAATHAQQTRFGEILRGSLIPALRARGIELVATRLTDAQREFLRADFDSRIRPGLSVLPLDDGPPPFLENRRLYLVVAKQPGPDALVELPDLPRFIELPASPGRRAVIFLDDAIRANLSELFPDAQLRGAWAVKLTRDAELNLEDEFGGDLVAAIRRGVARRATGLPSRFLYDPEMPAELLTSLQQRLALEEEDMVPGWRYHNLHDLAGFPRFGMAEFSYAPMPPLPHPELRTGTSLLDAAARRDRLLHFPYQSYDDVLRLLEEAATDPSVEQIGITLYRVAKNSAIVRALVRAAQAGKRVTAFVEAKARFDEESNLEAGSALEAAGARTLYSMPGLKVHAKIALITRRIHGNVQRVAYLSTGNFNERTARFYADHALMTADPRITHEVARVLAYLSGEDPAPHFEHLLVAPFDLRRRLYDLIAFEAAEAAAGRPAGMVLKMNSLEDDEIIGRLYDASRAGVPIDLIVRGICCLAPGIPGSSATIRARSIVDRWLEHGRIWHFHHAGEDRIYLASADWMTRNLKRRVEVAFPIFDPAHKAELRDILMLQLGDEHSARILDADMTNRRVEPRRGVGAQVEWYRRTEAGTVPLTGVAHG